MSTLARATDIVGMLEEMGIKVVRQTDKEIVAFCPMHEKRLGRPDHHPSWSINRRTGEHHCWSCDFGGAGMHSLVALASEVLGVSGWHASQFIDQFVGLPALKKIEMPQYEREAAPTSLYSEESLSKFKRPPEGALRKRRVSRESVEHFGVLWDPEWRAWVFPIREEDGSLRGYQLKRGRLVRNRPKDGVYRRECLFGSDVFPRGSQAIIVESPLDVLRFYTVGFDGGLASMGSAVSDEHMRLVLALTDQVVLALDDDDAGHNATKRLLSKYQTEIRNLRVFDYDNAPHHADSSRTAKDPGEMTDDDLMWALKHSKNVLALRLEAASV